MMLTMVRLPVASRTLFSTGRAHGLVADDWSVDLGYLVHALFARAFGDSAPKPFDVQERAYGDDGQLHVLAYAAEDHLGMAARARASGIGESAIDWSRAGSKAMPAFQAGRRLGFRVRVCPAVRVGKHHPRFAPGAEVDPYVALVQRDPAADAPPRETVYRDWLAARLGTAATLGGTRLVAMQDAHLWRKGAPRSGPARLMYAGKAEEKPRPHWAGRSLLGRRAAVFEGELTVDDPAAFAALLARGVGRHRAFGFGMLLLRPPED